MGFSVRPGARFIWVNTDTPHLSDHASSILYLQPALARRKVAVVTATRCQGSVVTKSVSLLTHESETGALEPPQPPPHSSVSGISSAARCMKQYQLQRVLGLEGNPSMAAAAGKAVHAAIEAWNRMHFAELGG